MDQSPEEAARDIFTVLQLIKDVHITTKTQEAYSNLIQREQ